MKEKLNPSLRSTEEAIETKIVLEYWVFCKLQTFVKQEK